MLPFSVDSPPQPQLRCRVSGSFSGAAQTCYNISFHFILFFEMQFGMKNSQCAGAPLLTQPPFDFDGMEIVRPLCKLMSGHMRAAPRVQLQQTTKGCISFLNAQLTAVNVRQRVCDRHTIPLFICVERCITSANCLLSTFRCPPQCGAFRGVPAVGPCSKLQKRAQYNLNSLRPL